VSAFALLAALAGLGLKAAAGGKADGPPNTLTPQEQKDGWKLLFDGKTLDGWRVFKRKDTSGWAIKDGTIYLEKPGSGDLMTEKQFGDFEFSVDWKFETGDNSGIIYRVGEQGNETWRTGPEMQVMPNDPKQKKLGKNDSGALYDMYAPKVNALKPRAEWNTFKVVANGKHLEQWVNGVKVVECDIGSDDWNERLAKSKWKDVKTFASLPAGHIALQDHGGKIAFRNVKIRTLSGAPSKE
jgi:hypothetical protein